MKSLTKLPTLLAVCLILLLVCGGCSADYLNPDDKGDVVIDGHTYKVFTVDGNYGQSYVHDPDCLLNDLDSRAN